MKAILVLVNGLRFPYHVMEYAIEEAKKQASSIHILFLTADRETPEGYGFPSDLAQSETVTDAEDALQDDEKIIHRYQELANHMTSSQGISCTTQVGVEYSLEDLTKRASDYLLICVDARFDDGAVFMPRKGSFLLDELVAVSSTPVKVISDSEENRRDSDRDSAVRGVN